MTRIDLKDTEVAIVLDEESNASAYIPKAIEESEDVECPKNTLLVAALCMAINNKDPHITAIIGNFLKLATPEEYNKP